MDIGILLWLQDNVRNDFLTPIMQIVSFLGVGGWFFIATSIIMCFFKKTRKIGICIMVAMLIEVILNNGMLKPIIARTRPYITYENLKLIGNPEIDYSFPSGHTGAAFAWAMAIYLATTKKKWGVLALILGFVMGFSRLYLGYHYPTDVLAGLLIGVVSGYLGYLVCKKYIFVRTKKREK